MRVRACVYACVSICVYYERIHNNCVPLAALVSLSFISARSETLNGKTTVKWLRWVDLEGCNSGYNEVVSVGRLRGVQ